MARAYYDAVQVKCTRHCQPVGGDDRDTTLCTTRVTKADGGSSASDETELALFFRCSGRRSCSSTGESLRCYDGRGDADGKCITESRLAVLCDLIDLIVPYRKTVEMGKMGPYEHHLLFSNLLSFSKNLQLQLIMNHNLGLPLKIYSWGIMKKISEISKITKNMK